MTESTERATAVPKPPPSAWRFRLQRAARLLAWSLAGLLLLWLLSWAGLPPLLKWLVEREAGATLGRTVSVQRVEFRPWTLELDLRGLRMAGAQDQGEQFSLDRLHLDLDLQSLLRLAPVLDAVELEGPHLRLHHLGAGRYDVDDILQRLLKPGQPPTPLPRFALFQFSLKGGAIDFTDDEVGHTQQVSELTLSLPFLSSLEHQREQAAEPKLDFLLNGDPVDARAMLRPFAKAQQGQGRLHSAGIDLAPYLPYWPAALPVRPTRGKLEFDLALRLPPGRPAPLELEGRLALRDAAIELPRDGQAAPLRMSWEMLDFDGSARLGLAAPGSDADPALELDGKMLRIDGFALHDGGKAPSRLDRLLLEDWQIALPAQQVKIARLQLGQPELQLQRDAGGHWNFERWRPAPAGPKATVQGEAKPAGQPAPTGAWQLEIGKLGIADGSLSLLDESQIRPVRLQLARIALDAGPWRYAQGKPGQLPLELGLQLTRDAATEGGTLHYKGDLTLPGPGGQSAPLAAQGSLELDELPLHLLEPYFASALNLELLRAELGLRSTLALSIPPEGLSLQLRGDGELARLRTSTLDPAERLLDWKSLGLRGLQLELERGSLARLKVDETVLSDYYARVVIDPQGRVNLQRLLRQPGSAPDGMAQGSATAPSPAASAASSAAESPKASTQPRLEFGPIAFVRGQVDFQDHFIRPNYSAHLSELTGRLGGFSNRPAKGGGAPELASLNLRGRAEGSATLEIEGQVNPLAQPLALDIRGKVDDLDLPPLSPYSVKYAGHGIEQGKLGMTVRYQVSPDGQLQASNQILLKQLQFGERVEGSEAPKLPIRLAVSLLADANGVIDVNLPISGSINDPQFRIGSIVWRMVLGLVGKAISAPFALIAHALGGTAEDFNQVDFALGSTTLDDSMLKRLQQVAQAMGRRADLRLTLEGQSDLGIERGAYQRAQLEQRLLEEKRRQLARSGKPVDQVEAPTPAEASKLLGEVYRRAEIPKPRNLLGMARELPAAEMEKLLLATIDVDADRMRELALARAAAVRAELVRLGVDHERIYLLAPASPDETLRDRWRPAVILGLGKD